MYLHTGIAAFTLLSFVYHEVCCQCTLGTTFASTTWHDNTKGTLTFTATGMSGWSYKSIRSSGTSTISNWQCVYNTDNTYLVLRTTSTFAFQPLSTTTAVNVYAYLCMQLTAVTTNSFIYYQQQLQEINLGGERLKVSASASLTQADVCDTSLSVPISEYHVLVKSGLEASAAIHCPDSLLFTADFSYISNDGTSACTGSGDRWDVCSDNTQMTITTNTCTQEIAFSASGSFYCVATRNASGYDYTTVYNLDDTISSTTSRFACLSSSGTDVSVAPGNCTAFQTPFSFPLEADQTTQTGHRLVITEEYVDCGAVSEELTAGGLTAGGLTAGEIAAIVITVLFIVCIWTLAIVFIIVVCIIAFIACVLCIVFVAEFTSHGDHIPRQQQKQSLTLQIDMPDIEKNSTAALDIDTITRAALEEVIVTSPSNVILNGKTPVDKGKSVHRSIDKQPTKTKSRGRKNV